MLFKNKNFLVYGYGQSGKSAVRLLKQKKAKVFVFDDNISAYKNSKEKNMFFLKKLSKKSILQMHTIIVSPAVLYENKWLQFARKKQIKIISELELGALTCKNKIVAITGTNGKTTTVKLLTKILNTQTKAVAVGNVGYPITQAVLEKKKGIFVTEVSSFMLENIDKFCPLMATITNITPDHLDRHETMENYTKLKFKIFKNFKKHNLAIINADDDYCKKLNLNCKILRYSVKNHVKNEQKTAIYDAYLKENCVYFKKEKIVALGKVMLKGVHNYYNILSAVLFAKMLKIKNRNIAQVLQTFFADAHRYEFVDCVNGITFVNDSKSTNIDSALKACESLTEEGFLLVGGYDKKLDYSQLFLNLPPKIVKVFCYGQIAQQLQKCADRVNFKNYEICHNLKDAFESATAQAVKNQTILLSPASSSFDEFENYKQRGEYFVKLVKDFKEKK